MTKRTLWMYTVAVLAIALFTFGCGGDDGVDQSVHDMVTAERDDAAAALAAAQAQAEADAAAAAAEIAIAEAEAAAAEAAQATAEALAAEAEMDEAEAQATAMAAQEAARTAQEAADAASTAAKEAADALTAAQMALQEAMTAQMAAEDDLGTAEDMVSELQSDAMNAEMVARASTLSTALDVINQTGTNNTTGQTPADADMFDLAASPPVTGQLEDDVAPGSVDGHTAAPDSLAFTYSEADGASILGLAAQGYTAGGEAPGIEGWSDLVLQRRDGANLADQVLYAYTNIGVEGETFYQKYGAGLTENKLTVSNANLALAASGSFPGATNPPVTFPGADATADAGVLAISFAGTFDGVAGTFSCATADGCMVTASATGTLSLGTGQTLVFAPTDGNAVIAPVSSDYLYFGYWLHKPDNPGAAHGFSVVSGGSDPFMVRGADDPRTSAVADDDYSIVHALAGTARYSGPAAGKWVTRDLENNTAGIGVFTATASLTADFDEDAAWMEPVSGSELTDAATRQTIANAGIVSGAISDFMDMDGNELEWHVTLANASLGAIGQASARSHGATADAMASLANDRTAGGQSTSRFMGSAWARIGAGAAAAGNWTGSFFGNDRVDGHPGAIAGNFEIISTHTSIGGSFGASNAAE